MPISLSFVRDPLFLTVVVAGAVSAAYVALLVIVLRHRKRLGGIDFWLTLTIVTAALSVVPHFALHPLSHLTFAYPGNLTQPALCVYLAALSAASFGFLSLRFLRRSWYVVWALLGAGWLALLLAVGFSTQPMVLGEGGWVSYSLQRAYPPGVIASAGWLGAFLIHLSLTFLAYRTSHLPEVANRLLFWAIVLPLFLLGAALGTSGVQPWAEIGWGVQLVGMGGAVYATTTHRVFDIRRALRRALITSLVTLVTALLTLVMLLIVQTTPIAPTFVELLVVAAVFAVLYIPLRRLAEKGIDRLMGRAFSDPTQALRRYSEDIVGQIDLDQLAERLVLALATVLKVPRGGLMLATRQNGAIALDPLWDTDKALPATGLLHPDSPIYAALCEERAVVLQYDLEYQEQFANAPADERAFFAGLRMSAYAPIVVDEALVGVLVAGPKANDDPFYGQDLELLATLANQTGVALRNARLVADLRALNADMAALNEKLNEANARYARLDTVKTDFITIASHELRTPLAQIRGYTDILAALNEQGLLDPTQVDGLMDKLRKACDRLEDLISDMLDVSQLDVNAMDLRFTETTADTVLRMAIEPLADSIKERKLSLSARGLRDLPPIQADLKRLVQAFRNIVLNAIKYTPDGGRIDIVAGVAEADAAGKPVAIQVAITDTGVGIAPENRELIFEKFFRGADPSLHSTGSTKFMGAGPGLGLTIARGVIDGHGGRIWCESPGYDPENFPGSTFYVILPVKPPDQASVTVSAETTGAATPTPV